MTQITRKANKTGVVYDPNNRNILFAEDWNNAALLLESMDARVNGLEKNGAPGTTQVKRTASGYPIMTLNITSGIEAEITMDGNTRLALAYTPGGSNYATLFIRQRPGGAITWPVEMTWDTPNGLPPALTTGDGMMDVIGVYERFGLLRGYLIDKAVRTADPLFDVPVQGGVAQYLFEEGTGMPRDTSGKGNHFTVFDGTWNPGGGVNLTVAQSGRTGWLRDFNPTQSWYVFLVLREISAHLPNHTHGGFSSDGHANDYVRFQSTSDGQGESVTARSTNPSDWATPVASSSLVTGVAPNLFSFRTAIVHSYNAANGRFSQWVVNNGDRRGHATSGGLKWSSRRALFNLQSIYRPNGGTTISQFAQRSDYTFIKQGLPSDADVLNLYNFCKARFASRVGGNLP